MLDKLIRRWFFDSNDYKLLSRKLPSDFEYHKETVIAIQTPEDYYYLGLYSLLIEHLNIENRSRFIGIYPKKFKLNQKGFKSRLYNFFSPVDNYFFKRKWKKLYLSIGIDFIIDSKRVPLSKQILFCYYAWRDFKCLKNKNDLLQLKIDDIVVGDLIYDTFLRFESKPTIDVNSLSIWYYVYQAYCSVYNANNILDKFPVSQFYSSYSTYIQHGVHVRVFIKSNVEVYTSGNLQQRFKKLSKSDLFHTSYFLDYKKIYLESSNRFEYISYGMQKLNEKFSGKIDTHSSYLKNSPFQSKSSDDLSFLNNFKGIVFLHDFFDSPHIYPEMLFTDFYEWAVYTIETIIEENLNIAVKPHPNQTIESSKIVELFKKKYSRISWIDTNISNLDIFHSNIEFGVSVYGTVLHELAYFGKLPIAAGDNPHKSFDFVVQAESKVQYRNLLKGGYSSMKTSRSNCRNEVAAFYYLHNYKHKEPLKIDFSKILNYNVFNSTSDIIPNVILKNQE